MTSYNFFPALTDEVPILISVPHCGIEFPEEIKGEYDQLLAASPDDTDWFVHDLYDFAPQMGMSMITARYSRWVVDLNRDPLNKPLYTDGRILTAICPATDFLGDSLYQDKRNEVNPVETDRRLRLYFWDYHKRIRQELDRLKKKFGIVLLWDCHSIRQVVKSIHPDKFSDLILGDADGKSADDELVKLALHALGTSEYSFSHNHPFKGGYITRQFGRPQFNEHALQLEMTKVNYMDDAEIKYNPEKAEKMRQLLRVTFSSLIKKLIQQ